MLVTTRQHRRKLDDVSVEEGRALGVWLGILSRTVVGCVQSKDGEVVNKSDVGDWNVVQNNG